MRGHPAIARGRPRTGRKGAGSLCTHLWNDFHGTFHAEIVMKGTDVLIDAGRHEGHAESRFVCRRHRAWLLLRKPDSFLGLLVQKPRVCTEAGRDEHRMPGAV